MVTSDIVINLIKEAIARHYKSLMISIVGKRALTRAEVNDLRNHGHVVPEKPSLMELTYLHSLLNPQREGGPGSIEDMESQQSGSRPKSVEVDYAVNHANESMKNAIEKLQQDMTTRITGLIHDNNQNFKFNEIKNGGYTTDTKKIMQEVSAGTLKQKLRDLSGDANRDWHRVATTEVSNAIGLGSVDGIVARNRENTANEIYVYRIPVNDGALCKWCRRFYLDDDESPAVYRLSTLLSNGSNYGKKPESWLPTITATHPRDRESGAIQLKPGWKVLPGGGQSYIGLDGWNDYIVNKLRE